MVGSCLVSPSTLSEILGACILPFTSCCRLLRTIRATTMATTSSPPIPPPASATHHLLSEELLAAPATTPEPRLPGSSVGLGVGVSPLASGEEPSVDEVNDIDEVSEIDDDDNDDAVPSVDCEPGGAGAGAGELSGLGLYPKPAMSGDLCSQTYSTGEHGGARGSTGS